VAYFFAISILTHKWYITVYTRLVHILSVNLTDKTRTHYTQYLHSQYQLFTIHDSHLISEVRECWKINIAVLQLKLHTTEWYCTKYHGKRRQSSHRKT